MGWYKNRRTGAVIETPCLCAGEDWEALNGNAEESKTTEAASAASRKPPERRKARERA